MSPQTDLNEGVPNDVNREESLAPQMIRFGICTIVFPLVFVLMRSYVRIFIIRHFGLDDWGACISFILIGALASANIWATTQGFGRHAIVHDDNGQGFLKAFFIMLLLYQLAMASLKASFLLQYRRVFPLPNLQRTFDILLVLVVLWGISQTLGILFQYYPVSGFWNRKIRISGINRNVFWLINAVVHILTHLMVLLIPMPFIKSLPINHSQKMVLVGVFGLGIITFAISIARIYSLKDTIMSMDPSWDYAAPVKWSLVELICACTCLCTPTLRPLVAKLIWLKIPTGTRPWCMLTKGSRRVSRTDKEDEMRTSSTSGSDTLATTGSRGMERGVPVEPKEPRYSLIDLEITGNSP